MKHTDVTHSETSELEYIEKIAPVLERVSRIGRKTMRFLGYSGVAIGIFNIAEGLKNNDSDSVRFGGALIGFSAFSYPIEKMFLTRELFFNNESSFATTELNVRAHRIRRDAIYVLPTLSVQEVPPEHQ